MEEKNIFSVYFVFWSLSLSLPLSLPLSLSVHFFFSLSLSFSPLFLSLSLSFISLYFTLYLISSSNQPPCWIMCVHFYFYFVSLSLYVSTHFRHLLKFWKHVSMQMLSTLFRLTTCCKNFSLVNTRHSHFKTSLTNFLTWLWHEM